MAQPGSTDTYYIGIDVAKGWLDIAVRPGGAHWRVANVDAELPALVERLRRLRPELVLLEATGGYERAVVAEARRLVLGVAACELDGRAAVRRHSPQVAHVLGAVAIEPLDAHCKPLAVRGRGDRADALESDVLFYGVGHLVVIYLRERSAAATASRAQSSAACGDSSASAGAR